MKVHVGLWTNGGIYETERMIAMVKKKGYTYSLFECDALAARHHGVNKASVDSIAGVMVWARSEAEAINADVLAMLPNDINSLDWMDECVQILKDNPRIAAVSPNIQLDNDNNGWQQWEYQQSLNPVAHIWKMSELIDMELPLKFQGFSGAFMLDLVWQLATADNAAITVEYPIATVDNGNLWIDSINALREGMVETDRSYNKAFLKFRWGIPTDAELMQYNLDVELDSPWQRI